MQNVELDEDMEMPCLCDCGKWFDLNDGYSSKIKKNVVICPFCHQDEEERTVEISSLKKRDKFIYRGDTYTVTRKWSPRDKMLLAVTEWSEKPTDFYYEDEEVIKVI